MKTAICAIIKDEHLYLKEWIDYHLSIGFDDIYLFEDKDSKSHEDIVEGYCNVSLRRYETDGEVRELLKQQGNSHRQLVLYSWFCDAYANDYDWVAFIDLDEFIFFQEGWTLLKLCEEFAKYPAVLLCWKMMGASGHINKPLCGVIEAYTHEASLLPEDVTWCYKSLVNLRRYEGMESLHIAINAVKTNHAIYEGAQDTCTCYEKAWINHYFTKSWEEWCNRIFKRGGTLRGHRILSQFFDVNTDMEDMREQLINSVSHMIPSGTYWLDKKHMKIAGGNISLLKQNGI